MRPDPLAPAHRRHLGDLLGCAWLVLLVVCFLSPALKDGRAFAPADLGSTLSVLTAGSVPLSHDCLPPSSPVLGCPHDSVNGDLIDQAIPWAETNWQLVHAGHFPLWNTLEGNGLPQFLNFESATLALPSLVSYLFPASLAFLVIIALKLLVAGLGTYWCARMLGARPLAATLGGSTFMLSGSFAGWLGWSLSGTLCWSGALLGAALWSYRSRHRAAPAALALAVAFALFGGFVEAYLLLAGFVALVLGAGALARAASGGGFSLARLDLRGVGRVVFAAVAGLALAAPLWLSGLSVLSASVRSGQNDVARGLAAKGVVLLFAQGYDGLPLAGSTFFGVGLPNYFESAAYLGIPSMALALVALWRGRRRPAVIGLAAGGLGALLLTYRLPGSPLQHLVQRVGLGAIDVSRILPLVGLATALLAALGAEELARDPAARSSRRALAGALALLFVAIALLAWHARGGLPAVELELRRASLYWPGALLVLLGAAALLCCSRRGLFASDPATGVTWWLRLALVAESAFLVFAGVGINSYASEAFPMNAATARLASLVGTSLVALDSPNDAHCLRKNPGIGYYPNINVGYGLDELALHDPIAPSAYFDSWPVAGVGQQPTPGCGGVNLFVPKVDSATLARRYGAAYILAAKGEVPPLGTSALATIATMTLYRVPDSGRFTLAGAGNTLVRAEELDDADWQLSVRLATAARLVARITDSPGWHATLDGRALALHRVEGTFFALDLPAGSHSVRLSYRLPHEASALALVVLALLALALPGPLALAAQRRRRRREGAAGASAPSDGAVLSEGG